MSTDVGLALQQMEAKNIFDHWYNDKKSGQIFRLFGGAGCKSGDTIIHYKYTWTGEVKAITLKEFVKIFNETTTNTTASIFYVQSYNQDSGKVFFNMVEGAYYTGTKEARRIITDCGAHVDITLDDKVLLGGGTFKKVINIELGEKIKYKDGIENVVSLKNLGEIDVYDLSMKAPWHNFVVNNGIVAHNTGKTFTAKELAKDKNVVYCAYTGKAASVMRRSGCYGASTIHSLIYKPVVHDNGKVSFVYDRNSSANYADLIIVDECSMVDQNIANDLLSFNKKILVLGDPQQLPPVNGHGFFTDAEPDYMLTDIHRQALDNPIILLATAAIQGERLDYGEYGPCKIVKTITDQELLDSDMIITGKNATRIALNKKIRDLQNRKTKFPEVGERLVCLKNNRMENIYNGQQFTVTQIFNISSPDFVKLELKSEDNPKYRIITKIHKCFFDDSIKKPFWTKLKGSNEFDYAYAITAHRAQGDQAKNVIVFDESYIARENKHKFLYTAITRAEESLTIVK